MKEWCYYYSLSDLSKSRRVRSSSSRRQPSKTLSNLDTCLSFFPVAPAAAASATVNLSILTRLIVLGSVWRSVFFFDSIRVFFKQTATLRGRDSGVCITPVGNLTKVLGILRSSSVSEISKSLQICFSVSKFAFTQHNVGDLSNCGGTGCGKVSEHSICRVFRGHLRLTCVKMYDTFYRLDKISYKFLHLGSSQVSWLIDRRVEVGERKFCGD